jgi:hypothetical protein
VREVTGSFVLELIAAVPATAERPETAAYARLLGQALAGETPSPTRWTMSAEEGDCRLFEPSAPFCEPKRTGGAVCVDDGVRAGYPRALDLGSATLSGVRTEDGAGRVVMTPVPPSNNYQLPGSPRLLYPPFEPGAEVTLEVTGGELAAFAIDATGFAPLALQAEGELAFEPDVATSLRWDAPAEPGTRVRVTVDISHHGGQKGEIRCESEDDGSLEIPASLNEALIALGVAGYPSLQVTRLSSGAVALAQGQVSFSLESPVTRELRIPGVVSCDLVGEQDVCPGGQLCQPERLCR